MIKLDNLNVIKGGKKILDIDSLDLNDSKRIGIFGKNGAGKTTLVKCLIDMEDYSGNIEFNFHNPNTQVLMQKNSYPPYAKVKDIISLILNIPNLDSIYEFIQYLEFENCLDKYITYLSGGELQKLNLILVLKNNPSLLIVDEATTGLDYETRSKVIKYIGDFLSTCNCRLIMVTHYLEELQRLTEKTIILDEGRVVSICESSEVKNRWELE